MKKHSKVKGKLFICQLPDSYVDLPSADSTNLLSFATPDNTQKALVQKRGLDGARFSLSRVLNRKWTKDDENFMQEKESKVKKQKMKWASVPAVRATPSRMKFYELVQIFQ